MDTVSRQEAIDVVNGLTKWYYERYHETRIPTSAVIEALIDLPTTQPDYTTIKSEIRSSIEELRFCGKYHAEPIRDNGEMIAHGMELTLQIIEDIERQKK